MQAGSKEFFMHRFFLEKQKHHKYAFEFYVFLQHRLQNSFSRKARLCSPCIVDSTANISSHAIDLVCTEYSSTHMLTLYVLNFSEEI